MREGRLGEGQLQHSLQTVSDLNLEGRALQSSLRPGRPLDQDAQNQGHAWAFSRLCDTLASECSLDIGGDLCIFLKAL